MTQTSHRSTATLWARFRFSVVGSLLSAPPARGELKAAIDSLAEKTWTHPVSGRDVRFAAVTIERWYYTRTAREGRSGRRVATRRTQGLWPGVAGPGHRPSVCFASTATIRTGATSCTTTIWPRWSRPMLRWGHCVPIPPCGGTCRLTAWCASRGRNPRVALAKRRPDQRRETREVRSYEAEYVGSLWHLDFHHGSLKVLTPDGQWQRPIALGILDDHSRLCCHLQWYLSETAEDLVHGLSQAIQKRGLPRALLTDNGPAMVAEEVTEGLLRLGDRPREDASLQSLSERQARIVLGDSSRAV